MAATDESGIQFATQGDALQVEDLIGILNHFLNTWSCHRSSILKALNNQPNRGLRIDPQVLQKLAMVMVDIGSVPSPPATSPPPTPPLPLLPKAATEARAIIEHVRELGRPSPVDREVILEAVKTSCGGPLSPDVLAGIARLSHRQLKRMSKAKLTHSDRAIIMEMECIKRKEA